VILTLIDEFLKRHIRHNPQPRDILKTCLAMHIRKMIEYERHLNSDTALPRMVYAVVEAPQKIFYIPASKDHAIWHENFNPLSEVKS
jgi:hypothetical protein